MISKTKQFFVIISSLFLIGLGFVFAQGPFAAMERLVGALGCGSLSECKAFCALPENIARCNAEAAKEGLVPPEKAAAIASLAQQGLVDDFVVCQRGEVADAKQCADLFEKKVRKEFAPQLGIPSAQEISKRASQLENDGTNKLATALANGSANCDGHNTIESCGEYCMTANPGKEAPPICYDFEKRFFEEGTLDRMRQQGFSPMKINIEGICQGLECREKCDPDLHPENSDRCFEVAVREHLVTADEAQQFGKMKNFEVEGICKGIQCKTACQNPANQEKCMTAAINSGFLPPEMKQMMSLEGPNGCRGPGCRSVCETAMRGEDQNLRQQCMDFFQKMPQVMGGPGMMGGGPGMMGGPNMGGPGMMMGGGPEMMKKMMPKPCQEKGISNPQDCQRFCMTDPDHCGFGGGQGIGPGGPSMMSGGPGMMGGGNGMMFPACQKAGIASLEECEEFCMYEDPDYCGQEMSPGGMVGSGVSGGNYSFDEDEEMEEYTEPISYNNPYYYLAQTVTAVKVKPIPAYLKKLAGQLKCKTNKDCQSKLGEMTKKDPKKLLGLINKYVDLKKTPKDFVKLIDLLKKEVEKLNKAAQKSKATVAKKTEQKPATPKPITATPPSPAAKTIAPAAPPKNPCPTVDEKQWQPIPPLPAPTKLCFGKKGDIDLVLAPKVSPVLPPYYFKKTPPVCAGDQVLAIKQDASGTECVAPGASPFIFKYDFCPPGIFMIPRPEDGDKPKSCFGFLPFISAFALWPYNAASSGYASIPETAKGENVRCDYTREARALSLDGEDIRCKLKELVKDLYDPNDTKTKFEGYELSDRYSVVFPAPNIYSSTGTYATFEDQGQMATMCSQGKYAMSNKTFGRLTYEICKLFVGASYSSMPGGYSPH